MILSPQSFLDTAVIPAAKALGVYTLPHLQIGFDTTGHESGFRAIRQIGGGPALGPCQMEPATHDSLWANFIKYREPVSDAFQRLLGGVPPSPDLMMTNMTYAAMMMLTKYLDSPGEIPADLQGQAGYYVRWYNGGGKATAAEYIADHKRFASTATFPSFGSDPQ